MDEGMLQNQPIEIEEYAGSGYDWIVIRILKWSNAGCSFTLKTSTATIYTSLAARTAYKYDFSATCGSSTYMKTWKQFADFKKVVFPDEVMGAFPDLPLDIGEWDLVYENGF